MRKVTGYGVGVLMAACVALVLIGGLEGQTPQTISALPTSSSPPKAAYVMIDDGSTMSKATITNVVSAEIPNAPSPEPSCVISAGTCTVDVAVSGGAVHECVGNGDSSDTNGPFVVNGHPSPAPSAGVTTGYHFLVAQVTPTSTPTVHLHIVCR